MRADAPADRCDLGDGAWVEVVRGWLEGSDALFEDLRRDVPWTQGRRRMYDSVLDDPRLSRWYGPGDDLPHPALVDLHRASVERCGVPFGSLGLNYYRGGDDSVAFHRDRELRDLDDTRIAIVTLGATRPFLLRPKGGGRSIDLRPAGGDLLVMGGRCQVTWEHGVPKARGAGPRISVSMRWSTAGDVSWRG